MRDIIDGVGKQSAGYLHVRLAAGERDEVHVAHAGLEAEDLLPVAAREHTHLPSEGSFAPSKPIRANQSQSEVVHLPSEAIRGHPRSSVSISAYPRQSECNQSTIRVQSECNQSAIRGQSEGNQRAIRGQSEGNQRAIRGQSEGNQCLMRTEPSAAPTSSAFPSGVQCTHETCPLGCGTTYAHWPASVSHAFS